MDWLSLAKDFGIPLCLVLFFVLETKRREDRMAERMDKDEDYTRTELVRLVESSRASIEANSAVMERLEEWLERQCGGCDVNQQRRPPQQGKRRSDPSIPRRPDAQQT